MSQANATKMILFYSRSCKHCNEFRRLLEQTRFRNAFKLACIDPVPGTNVRPDWVIKYQSQFLKMVPTIIVGKNVYQGKVAFKWLTQTTGISTKNRELEGSTKIAAFKEDEMLGTASDWSFVKGGKHKLAIGEFEYLRQEPRLQEKDDNKKVMRNANKIKASTIDIDGQKGWQPVNVERSMNVDPSRFADNIREQDYEIKTRNTMSYNQDRYRPARPRREINFQLPQLSGSRRDAASEIENRLAQRQMEYDEMSRPMPPPQQIRGGRNRYRRQQPGARFREL